MVKITYSMIKRSNTRSCTYSAKGITAILDRLNWNHQIIPPATMILTFWKEFETKEQAIQGRKELDTAFRLYHPRIGHRLDGVTLHD
jgi:hypothetical protein